MLERLLIRASFKDFLIAVFAALGIVGFWRGSWNLMDTYLFPKNYLLSQVLSLIIGLLILLILSRRGGWKK